MWVQPQLWRRLLSLPLMLALQLAPNLVASRRQHSQQGKQ
jgi:hypothetical protein